MAPDEGPSAPGKALGADWDEDSTHMAKTTGFTTARPSTRCIISVHTIHTGLRSLWVQSECHMYSRRYRDHTRATPGDADGKQYRTKLDPDHHCLQPRGRTSPPPTLPSLRISQLLVLSLTCLDAAWVTCFKSCSTSVSNTLDLWSRRHGGHPAGLTCRYFSSTSTHRAATLRGDSSHWQGCRRVKDMVSSRRQWPCQVTYWYSMSGLRLCQGRRRWRSVCDR